MQLSAFGVNFHKACSRGIVVEFPLNFTILLQTFGRLWRIGQESKVVWDLLYQRDSYDCAIEARNIEKYVSVLMAEGCIDGRIKGEARAIVAYEIIRQILNESCSRYPRLSVPWDVMDSQELQLEGLFYSALAVFFTEFPDDACLVTRNNVQEIAFRWRVGAKITTGMLSDECPRVEEEERVQLHNFIDLVPSSQDDEDPDTPTKGKSRKKTYEERQRMQYAARRL